METQNKKNPKADGAAASMAKYMVDVTQMLFLSDLVHTLNEDVSSFPQWKKTLVLMAKSEVQKFIKMHFDTCAYTRQMFASMPPELWTDDNELFRLTEKPRQVLGYLPKKELVHIDGMIQVFYTEYIVRCRDTIRECLTHMRSSEADDAEVAPLLAKESFFIKDVENHQEAVDKWTGLRNKKVPILEELEKREMFLEEIDEFEAKHSGDPSCYVSGNSLDLEKENKWRAQAAKQLKEMDTNAIDMCNRYKKETGREFEVDGVLYAEMIKEQQFGRPNNPALTLAKLRPEAIPAGQKSKFSGGKDSNLVPVKDDGHQRKLSLHEQGQNPNRLIRDGKRV